MIAKLCTHAPTRLAAVDAMATALDQFYIEGIANNIGFVSAIMHNTRFREGRLTTAFIAEEFPDGFHGRPLDETLTRRFTAAAVAAKLARTARASSISGTLNGAHHSGTEFQVTLGQTSIEVNDAYFLDGRFRAHIDGIAYEAQIDWEPGETIMHITEGSERSAVQIERLQGGYKLSHGGAQVIATARSRVAASLAALMPKKAPPDTSRLLMCPMPGLVVSVNVTEGQDVKSGETLAVVEAMKMENVLLAERDGIIKKVNVRKGDSLALDDVILEFA